MDRLEAMKTFVRVVERGSFSAVAKEDVSCCHAAFDPFAPRTLAIQ
jgi:hypothetical protein